MVDRVCGACGASYKSRPSRTGSRYCSRKCQAIGNTIPAEDKIRNVCAGCGEIYIVKRPNRHSTCCSSKCLGRYNSAQRRKIWLAEFLIQKTGQPGCWEWPGTRSDQGYGTFKDNGKRIAAHRAAWESENGPVPDGLDVLHSCDNPPCCRPSHLFLGTQADNNADRDTKGRGARGSDFSFARLSPAAVLQIRSSALSDRKCAAEFGVSRGTIRAVRAYLTWRHVA